jgi:hypothetical protein
VALVTRRRWLAAAVVATAVLLVGVGAIAGGWLLLPYNSPGSRPVTLTVVSRTGPRTPGDAILASPSLGDLTKLANALDNIDLCPDGTCWPGPSVPPSSLLIALPRPAPCRRSVLNADLSAGGVLEVHVVVGPWECSPGSNAITVPNFWLLAVPLDALRSKALAVVVDDRPPIIDLRAGYLNTWTTIVDLRLPDPTSGGVISEAELRSAMDASRLDAESRGYFGGRILELGLFRWQPGASVCAATTGSVSDESWGSFIVRADSKTAVEYHSVGGATVFCRSQSL